MFSMVSIIIVSYGKQQEKHKRMQEWMKQNLNNRRDRDDESNNNS